MNKRVHPGYVFASWLIAAGCASQPTFAAREFTPQAGTWVISDEVDGNPGRGVAIDVQGNTFFMQVFSYAKDGSATFHTAVGEMVGNSVAAPLIRYRGGRAFGAGDSAASEEGTAGQVALTFTDGLNGTIQFPGEQPKAIARMLLVQGDPLYRNLMWPPIVPGWDPGRGMSWVGKDSGGARNLWNVTLKRESEGEFVLYLADQKRVSAPVGFYGYATPRMKMRCTFADNTQVYDCARVAFPEGDLAQGALGQDLDMPIGRVKFRLLGRDVVGNIITDQSPAQRMELMGLSLGARGAGTDCSTDGVTMQGYVPGSLFLNDDCLGVPSPAPKPPAGFTHIPGNSIQPVNGTWIVESEMNGQPGRGISLDVQDTVLFAQIANFRKDGSATFHTASGVFIARAEQGNVTGTTAELIEYRGGRHFGGPAQSAKESARAGSMKIGFKVDYVQGARVFNTGTIQFPGEAPQTIRRLAWQSGATHLERLLGEFYLPRVSEETSAKRNAVLERLVGPEFDSVINADGSVACNGHQDPTTGLPAAQCHWREVPIPSTGAVYLARGSFVWDPFDRIDNVVRTRDRHGNWMGLGKVDLPGLDFD